MRDYRSSQSFKSTGELKVYSNRVKRILKDENQVLDKTGVTTENEEQFLVARIKKSLTTV